MNYNTGHSNHIRSSVTELGETEPSIIVFLGGTRVLGNGCGRRKEEARSGLDFKLRREGRDGLGIGRLGCVKVCRALASLINSGHKNLTGELLPASMCRRNLSSFPCIETKGGE